MGADYPAAHSMDTWWFAIDEVGQVGVFFTGENGHLPALEVRGRWDDIEAVLPALDDDGADPRDWYARRGLVYYDYPDDYGGLLRAYVRTAVPAHPLHVDQLPPAFRDVCRMAHFRGADFARSERLQPLEFFACHFWSELSQVAYVSADGVTVRPVPGKEGDFAAFVRGRHQYDTESLRFEGLTE